MSPYSLWSADVIGRLANCFACSCSRALQIKSRSCQSSMRARSRLSTRTLAERCEHISSSSSRPPPAGCGSCSAAAGQQPSRRIACRVLTSKRASPVALRDRSRCPAGLRTLSDRPRRSRVRINHLRVWYGLRGPCPEQKTHLSSTYQKSNYRRNNPLFINR